MTEKKAYQIFPASVLKLVAIITMAIDHVGATFVWDYVMLLADAGQGYRTAYTIYQVMRGIGRIAFPIYCFLLVEGFSHTRSKARYARNLLIFALVSEIPFDLAFERTLFNWEHQNVFWTLFLGLLSMLLLEKVRETNWRLPLRLLASVPIVMLFPLVAYLCKTDYNAWGVATILVIYFLKSWRVVAAIAGCTVLSIMYILEAVGFVSVPLIACYNGERGRQNKYFFYAFYPVHLVILYLVYLVLKNRRIL